MSRTPATGMSGAGGDRAVEQTEGSHHRGDAGDDQADDPAGQTPQRVHDARGALDAARRDQAFGS